MEDGSRFQIAAVIASDKPSFYGLCRLSLCLYSTTAGKPTSFRVESREFKPLKWENLRERNSNAECGFEFG
jgi:hypothetical protein